MKPLNDAERLARIKEIIFGIENRCMAADGPVPLTSQEITEREVQKIYALTCGQDENWRPNDGK